MEIAGVSSKSLTRLYWKHVQFLQAAPAAVQRHSVRYKTGYGTGPAARVQTKLDQGTERYLEENNLKPGKHPGIFHLPKISLPEKFSHAAELILRHENIHRIKEGAEDLQNYVWSRQLPIEKQHLREKALKIEEDVRMKDEALLPFLSEAQSVKLQNRKEREILSKLRRTVYHWDPINYTKDRALQYLFGRSAAEYAVLARIFNEMALRDPEFKPKTLCDFGSGLCTVTWAARHYWASTLNEHLCADVSWEMNELAELILRGGGKNNDHSIPALFFRQHLPESFKIRYDLVVSAFSLMELPSARDRLTIIDKLWNKTEDCLVIVEAGTGAGFRAIIEARNYILGLDDVEKRPRRNCHVFSPCPNKTECPRFAFDTIPCNFEVKYRPLYPFHQDNCERERFCYVVLRRGRPRTNDAAWPRLIQEPMKRPRHIICRMCTEKGTISETVLTKAKHSQQLRLVAKRSDWGDLLPIDMQEFPPPPPPPDDDYQEN